MYHMHSVVIHIHLSRVC